MNWRGVDGSSSASAIQAKIRKFRENHVRRQNTISQPSQGVNAGSSQGSDKMLAHNNRSTWRSRGSTQQLKKYGLHTNHQDCLKSSNSSNPLAAHLQETDDCLNAYQREYFAGRSDTVNRRRALFDLSLLLGFCPNPGCSVAEDSGGPAEHLEGLCSQYIINEAVAVYGWKKDVGRARFKGSLKRRATYLR